ncbi:RNA polymerase sigma factor [Robiginitalea sp. M366]|uniref:RNA polymerase sigma factor n=1 Tax=Robiginitalea aestuariiviva TaxID=3036903 RepID=UPI00240CEE2C|nr:RNA polymerase sigma factor [Robiginitalea aestuariiviva]MDG1573468.1 RNA polymerase sigma factor [Robiginitalea aestuariiviva]
MTSEADFIAALRDPAQRDLAFRRLVETYQERLYWHIRRIVLSHDDTDDVLQNTFIKVFKHIGQFKGDSQLYSWLYRIATNEALSFLRKRSRMQGFDEAEMQEYMVSRLEADPYFDGDAAQRQLQQALARLPEKQRLVFNMKYFEEMKYDDISEVLDTSVGALKASYHHAVKKIEQYLKTVNA